MVDEVGYQPLERAEANLVFQVISKRYEKGSIIPTSNKTFSEWTKTFTDLRLYGVGAAGERQPDRNMGCVPNMPIRHRLVLSKTGTADEVHSPTRRGCSRHAVP